MNRPYIICHMVTSIDGKVTGDYLFRDECKAATDVYYEINREMKCDGYICGRVTMQGSFAGDYYPDLSEYEPVKPHPLWTDFIPDVGNMTGFYAIAFDPEGKLGWKSNRISDPDGDPGYDGALIIEVVTEKVDKRYLAYLEALEIPYIFAGETEIDVDTALFKLKNLIGAKKLLLEGGSIVNGYFERAELIDELSLVISPVIASADSKPLFSNSVISDFTLKEINSYPNGVVHARYIKVCD